LSAIPAVPPKPSLAELASAVLRGEHMRVAYPFDEAGAILGDVSDWWLRKLYRTGKLRCLRVAGKLMVPAGELDRLVAEAAAPYQPATQGIGLIAPRFNRQRAAARRKQRAISRKPAGSTSGKTVRTARAS
jgi:hypothetical protein